MLAAIVRKVCDTHRHRSDGSVDELLKFKSELEPNAPDARRNCHEVLRLNGQPRRVKIHEGNRTAVRTIEQTGIVPVVGSCYSQADFPAAFDHFNRGTLGKSSLT
ncbi:MAG: hypothetical protein EON58_18850 [Alphaproteobacteria bacterium]|nr:MAG: hypothetical protein EON58_18850 [Alphaproteobacteria bacterium]